MLEVLGWISIQSRVLLPHSDAIRPGNGTWWGATYICASVNARATNRQPAMDSACELGSWPFSAAIAACRSSQSANDSAYSMIAFRAAGSTSGNSGLGSITQAASGIWGQAGVADSRLCSPSTRADTQAVSHRRVRARKSSESIGWYT